jgi:hypothetical protein
MANNWAIVVGINDYDFLKNASLRFAERDALAIKHFLCEDAGFAAERVLLCGSGSEGRKATRSVLRDILITELRRAENADNLWFFFGGHGQQKYLLPSDGNPQDLNDTAISIDFVTDQLRACKAKNIVLILDMCRTGIRTTGERSTDSMEDSIRDLVKSREDQQGIIMLLSCSMGESSYEIADLQHGAFTYALLEGLRKHSILKDLETYLEKRVPELNRSCIASGQTRQQVPVVVPEPGWKYNEPILSHYATAMDIQQLKDMAIDAESDQDIKKALRLWEQVNLVAMDVAERQRALKRISKLHLSSTQSVPDQREQVNLVAMDIAERQRTLERISKLHLSSTQSVPDQLEEKVISIEEFAVMLGQDPTLVKEVAEQLGIKTNNPQVVLDLVIVQMQSQLPESKENEQGKYLESLEDMEGQITLVSPNPAQAYVHWDVPVKLKRQLRQQGGKKLSVRMYDVTSLDINQPLPIHFQESECHELSWDIHLPVPKADRQYLVEIGYVTDTNQWMLLARSTPVWIRSSAD